MTSLEQKVLGVFLQNPVPSSPDELKSLLDKNNLHQMDMANATYAICKSFGLSTTGITQTYLSAAVRGKTHEFLIWQNRISDIRQYSTVSAPSPKGNPQPRGLKGTNQWERTDLPDGLKLKLLRVAAGVVPEMSKTQLKDLFAACGIGMGRGNENHIRYEHIRDETLWLLGVPQKTYITESGLSSALGQGGNEETAKRTLAGWLECFLEIRTKWNIQPEKVLFESDLIKDQIETPLEIDVQVIRSCYPNLTRPAALAHVIGLVAGALRNPGMTAADLEDTLRS
jgi:hypothetical protein